MSIKIPENIPQAYRKPFLDYYPMISKVKSRDPEQNTLVEVVQNPSGQRFAVRFEFKGNNFKPLSNSGIRKLKRNLPEEQLRRVIGDAALKGWQAFQDSYGNFAANVTGKLHLPNSNNCIIIDGNEVKATDSNELFSIGSSIVVNKSPELEAYGCKKTVVDTCKKIYLLNAEKVRAANCTQLNLGNVQQSYFSGCIELDATDSSEIIANNFYKVEIVGTKNFTRRKPVRKRKIENGVIEQTRVEALFSSIFESFRFKKKPVTVP